MVFQGVHVGHLEKWPFLLEIFKGVQDAHRISKTETKTRRQAPGRPGASPRVLWFSKKGGATLELKSGFEFFEDFR